MRNMTFSTVIAEDEDLIRSGLVRKIEQSRKSFAVVGEAAHGEEALELVRRLQPQLLVTDIRMPVMDGLKLIEEVHKYYPRTAVIVASGYADFEYARKAMKFNVKHYLLKPIKQQELAEVLDDIRAQLSKEPIVETNDIEKTVQRVQQYLREHFHEDISLEQLAKQFNFSSAYLSKIFLKHAGEAPSKYIAALRINEAKRLLKQRKDLPVKTVGEQVGYSDPFYFSRIFKQATGMTPREYQK
ncbi:response regulator [Paenibacillaceae bacterium WGS1546]|uniref:response regulator transcription factor n=1 Tax=Cohnella sp. WGS1546 TaxID=3366810 RepID=UPI00372CEE47